MDAPQSALDVHRERQLKLAGKAPRMNTAVVNAMPAFRVALDAQLQAEPLRWAQLESPPRFRGAV
jgi:hypothetical protein